MRRRLWWQICVLDMQASIDRGSDPIITLNSFSTHQPLHVNDDDLIPGDIREVQPRQEYTDMTHTLVGYEVFYVERRLNYVPAGDSGRSDDKTNDRYGQRRVWVLDCQQRLDDKYLRYCDMTIPKQRYTKVIADVMIATLWLWIYRPLQKPPGDAASIVSSHSEALQLSVGVMEKALQIPKDPSFAPFSWVLALWVEWHPLAVMIAELCVQTNGQTVERAWDIVNSLFDEIARHVADSNKGRLWRPIKKLMSKAQAVRKQYLDNTDATFNTLATEGSLMPTNPSIQWMKSQDPGSTAVESGRQRELQGEGSSAFVQQQSQESVPAIQSTFMSWDPWHVMRSVDQDESNNELDQMAWTNWEGFIDDFHANGDFLPGVENALPTSFDM